MQALLLVALDNTLMAAVCHMIATWTMQPAALHPPPLPPQGNLQAAESNNDLRSILFLMVFKILALPRSGSNDVCSIHNSHLTTMNYFETRLLFT